MATGGLPLTGGLGRAPALGPAANLQFHGDKRRLGGPDSQTGTGRSWTTHSLPDAFSLVSRGASGSGWVCTDLCDPAAPAPPTCDLPSSPFVLNPFRSGAGSVSPQGHLTLTKALGEAVPNPALSSSFSKSSRHPSGASCQPVSRCLPRGSPPAAQIPLPSALIGTHPLLPAQPAGPQFTHSECLFLQAASREDPPMLAQNSQCPRPTAAACSSSHCPVTPAPSGRSRLPSHAAVVRGCP